MLRCSFALGLAAVPVTAVLAAPPLPPVAERRPTTHTLHGDVRVDEYAWLRNRDDPATIAYLEAENEYTEKMMAPTDRLQEALY